MMKVTNMMKPVSMAALVLIVSAGFAQAKMGVQLLAPWDGKRVPAGQNCTLDGGNGSTPPMKITGLPGGTVLIVVEYNDKSYPPLSSRGGHGTIGYPVSGSSAKLPAVPGLTANLPGGVRVIKRARGTGRYASKGYLPPCSGGRGNRYSATVKAISQAGKVLEKATISIGRY